MKVCIEIWVIVPAAKALLKRLFFFITAALFPCCESLCKDYSMKTQVTSVRLEKVEGKSVGCH